MSGIKVKVTGTPPSGTYTSSDPNVQSNGTITMEPGITKIRFVCGSDAWQFEEPWFTFKLKDSPPNAPLTPNGPFKLTANDAKDLVVEDNDPRGVGGKFEYTLYTTKGKFDPEIINKGGGG